MGTFRIEITAAGDHGCKRDAKEGEKVYGCRRMDCPDCQTAAFVKQLAASGASVEEATFTHWPEEDGTVVDAISADGCVIRKSGDF